MWLPLDSQPSEAADAIYQHSLPAVIRLVLVGSQGKTAGQLHRTFFASLYTNILPAEPVRFTLAVPTWLPPSGTRVCPVFVYKHPLCKQTKSLVVCR